MAQLSSGVEAVLKLIITEAYALFKLYRSRDAERKTFAMFMKNVAHVLESIAADVPPHAEPVVRELGALVGVAFDKLGKYESRGGASSLWHIRNETARMRSIMDNVQQLLPLLTVSVASAGNVAEAVADLQRRADSLQGSSAEAAAHLCHISAAVESMAATNATVADVQQCMCAMHDSMLQLSADSTQKVLEGCVTLQLKLGDGLEKLSDAVDVLQLTVESFSRQMLAMQREMSSDIDQIKRCLERFCNMPAGTAEGMQSERLLEALDELSDTGDGAAPASNETLAAALKEAVTSGKLSVTSCLVLGVPLMPEGPLRPVTLPCCGFVVSHTGAQQLQQQRQCTLCHAPLDADAAVEENETVSMVVAAEGHGYAPRQLRSSDVTIGKKLGAGGEGTVHEGLIGERVVAVKQVPLPAGAGAKAMASVKQVVSATYIAGVASPFVCKLHGYCWTDTELWLCMELCKSSLSDLVPVAKQQCRLPGLPPLDVVTLGLMLCSALDAVHRSARCLHLDLTPGNVLLVPSKKPSNSKATDDNSAGGDVEAQHSTAQHSVRLADFGLAKRLPTCVRTSISTNASLVTGVAKGTPGYASKEQLLGKAQRRSDVYSLGATLLFAATGAHPYSGDTLEGILAKLFAGLPVPVPAFVGPPALKQLITSMTAIEPDSRPPLASVQQQLLAIQVSLVAEGHSPQFIAFGNSTVALGLHAQQPLPSSLASRVDADASKTGTAMKPSGIQGPENLKRSGGEDGRALEKGSPGHACEAPAALSVASAPATDSSSRPSVPGLATSGSGHRRDSDVHAAPQQGQHADSLPEEASSTAAPSHLDQGPSVFTARPAAEQGYAAAAPAVKEIQEDINGIHTVWQLFTRLASSSPGRGFTLGFRHIKQPLPLTRTKESVDAVKACELLSLQPGSEPATERRMSTPWRRTKTAGPNHSVRRESRDGQLAPAVPIQARMAAVLSTGGATVSNACLQLGAAGALVLQGDSCTVLRDCVVQGGFLICDGPKCSLELQGVALDQCKLIVHGGATVTMHATHARQADPAGSATSPNEHAVLVAGEGSTLRVSEFEIFSTYGLDVRGGATVTGDWLHAHGKPDGMAQQHHSHPSSGFPHVSAPVHRSLGTAADLPMHAPHAPARQLSAPARGPLSPRGGPARGHAQLDTPQPPRAASMHARGGAPTLRRPAAEVEHYPGTGVDSPAQLQEDHATEDLEKEDITGIHTVAALVSRLSGSQQGRIFPFGFLHLKQPLPLERKSILKPEAICQVASALGLKHSSGKELVSSLRYDATAADKLLAPWGVDLRHGAVLSQGGATVANACLQLGRCGVLLLEGTSDVAFTNVAFQGGLLLCHGSKCRLTLTDVELEDCKLVVSGGATATIRTATAAMSETAQFKGHAVLVTGAGSAVSAEELTVRASAAVAVEDGGAVTLQRILVNSTKE